MQKLQPLRKRVEPLQIKLYRGNFLAAQWLGLGAFPAGAGVQSLVRKLRFHLLYDPDYPPPNLRYSPKRDKNISDTQFFSSSV